MVSIYKKAESDDEIKSCFDLRRTVFVEEQKVPADRETDEFDEESIHFMVLLEGKTIATSRVRLVNGIAKIERMAVLRELRGKGIGRKLIKHILNEINIQKGPQAVKLSSQTSAVDFYKKLGFKIAGSEYMDANIPHYDMIKEV